MTDSHTLDPQTIKDMAGDVEDSIAWGNDEETFYQNDETPYPEFSAAADNEYENRTGVRPEPGLVAAAIKTEIDSPEGQEAIAEESQAAEEFDSLVDGLGDDF